MNLILTKLYHKNHKSLILTGVEQKVKCTDADGNTHHFYYIQNKIFLIQFLLTGISQEIDFDRNLTGENMH